jgi:UDP-N-acetylmuramyl pentapeptide phosphotransferase/UDP-N-acetylglucosamine-1-phosphate transferase
VSASLLAALFVFGASTAITLAMRWLATRLSLYDHPGDRSSHTVPTPRLGGVGIAVATIGAWIFTPDDADLPARVIAALYTGGVLIALVGLIDDLRGLSPIVKFGGEVLAVVALLSVLRLDVPGSLQWIAVVTAGLWMLSYINFFNFMDGTDGLAGGVAVIAASGLAILALKVGAAGVFWMLVTLASATAGFLLFNRPRASIFMGDAGSLFLGYSLAALVVYLTILGVSPVASGLILGPFLFDATFTLIDRARRREPLWRAHRDHLYQRLVRDGASHGRVMIVYCGWTILTSALAWLWLSGPSQIRPLIVFGAALPGIALLRYSRKRAVT